MEKKPHAKLFIPGPVDVADDVLEAMSGPMISHRGKDWTELQKNCAEKIQKLFLTTNPIIFSTSSGSGLMEGSIRSCTAKRAVVFSVGSFGDRWFEMADWNGIPADKVEVPEWGMPTLPEEVDKYLSTGKYDVLTITHNETSTGIMNPVAEIAEVVKKYPNVIWLMDAVSSMGGVKIETDKLGVDIMITSSQKCLGVPPGLAMCSVSQRAIERAKTVKNRGFYFDIVQLYKFVTEKDHQYPSTPTTPHMYGLACSLDKMMKEGFENVYARHEAMMRFAREWGAKHFEVLVKEEKYASRTVSCIKNTRNLDLKEVSGELKKRGYVFSDGYGKLKDKTFRIPHMAGRTMDELKTYLGTLEEVMKLK